MVIQLLLLGGLLLAMIAAVEALSLRWSVSESVLLALMGAVLGAANMAAGAMLPAPLVAPYAALVLPLLTAHFPAEVFLWVFLPMLLFQAAVSVNVRDLLADAAPILLLAVVAVFVATGMIGLAVALSGHALVDGLLLGAMIATTDPSAVLALFRQVGAPARLVRLVEGESLLNDAAAIAIVGVLLAALTGDAGAATPLLALRALAVSFVGALAVGAAAGRLVAWLLPRLGGAGQAEVSLVLALPYPLYLVTDQYLHLSGVVAVVAAGLMISGLGRTRLSPRNWRQLQRILEQAAGIAGAAVFLLAAIRVPLTLRQAGWDDILVLLLVVPTALLARALVLFGMFPLLSRLRLSAPVSRSYKLVIAWGGLRGAVTLVLAMGMAENTALPETTRRFVSIIATAFVLVSLFVNGGSLKLLIRRLRLDRLSPQDLMLQRQVVKLSAIAVEHKVDAAALAFGIGADVVAGVQRDYRRQIGFDGAAASPISDTEQQGREALPTEPARLAIGLVALASRERDLIPQFGSGLISVHNLDTMMRVTESMIEAAREDGRLGYRRASRRLLDLSAGYRLARLLARYGWRAPLDAAIADRFELLICRRVVITHLRTFAADNLAELFGARLVVLLQAVLDERIASVDKALADVRLTANCSTHALEQRLLLLYALRSGRDLLAAMFEQRSISREVYDSLNRELELAWRRAAPRPQSPAPAAST
jgi:CPA1 family monovalent cation:H+ antiporter